MGTGVSTLLWPPDLTNAWLHEGIHTTSLGSPTRLEERIERKKEGPAATYSPTANRSTIGVRVLNFRVRDGNGCVHPAVATGPANAWEREDPRTTGLGSPRDWNSDMVKPLG